MPRRWTFGRGTRARWWLGFVVLWCIGCAAAPVTSQTDVPPAAATATVRPSVARVSPTAPPTPAISPALPRVLPIAQPTQIITPTLVPLPYPTGDIAAVSFLAADTGWIVVSDAVWQRDDDSTALQQTGSPTRFAILVTSDGGRTWQPQYQSTEAITGVSFISPRAGWAATAHGLLATTDGGARWQAVEPTRAVALSRVQFVDAAHGWIAAAPNDLWRTSDGGATWTPIPNPCPLNDRDAKNPFSFADARHGWILCGSDLNPYTQRMTLFATTDGGQRWRQVQQDHRRDPALQLEPDSYTSRAFERIGDLGFADARHAWIGTAQHLLVTDDGGVSWRIATVPPHNGGFLRVAHLPSSTQGFVVSTDERTTLLRTDDSGARWQQVYPPITPLWPHLTPFSRTQALGMGSVLNPSAILKTWDGGRSWHQIGVVNPACAGQVFALSFVDRLHGGAVSQCWNAPGITTTVSLTEDGGWTWRTLPLAQEDYWTITRRSATTIYLSTHNRVVQRSRDGGATFQRLPALPLAGQYSSWHSFVFLTDQLWWHVADVGFAVTTDGGRTWTPMSVPAYTWVWGVRPNDDLWYWRASQCAGSCGNRQFVNRGDQWLLFNFGALPVQEVTFLDDQHGWLAVAGGRWYRTDDGGHTWTQLA